MRCLYEVLNVERDVDDATLKAAYRKAAFRWHPDKNQDNLEEAGEKFKEVQNAYEVLSDKHERAWYDGHRSEILQQADRHQAGGGESFARGQAPEDEIILFPFFSATCFNGYKDGPAGYYGVYEDLFARLDAQERAAEEAGSQNPTSRDPAPKFGSSSAEWPQISGFYSYWGAFSTAKSCAWADKYNPATAPNRKVRRLMEDENRKIRKTKRREFSETVRELLAFVKKRDKRVAAHQAEEAKRRQDAEALEKARREGERKERLQRAREFEEATWAQAEAEAESADESAEEDIPDELYCLACDKMFRTPNAMANHNRSKKHLEKVSLLREVLAADDSLDPSLDPSMEPNVRQQGATGRCAATTEDGIATAADLTGSAKEQSPLTPAELEIRAPVLHAISGDVRSNSTGQLASKDAAAEVVAAEVSRASSDSLQGSEAIHDSVGSEAEESEDSDQMLAALLRKQSQKEQQQSSDTSAGEESIQESPGEEENAAAFLEDQDGDRANEATDLEERVEDMALDDTQQGEARRSFSGRQKQPVRKSRRRRDKGGHEAKSGTEGSSRIEDNDIEASIGGRQKVTGEAKKARAEEAKTCCVCGASFTSRTKMFQHIRESSHAALRP